MALLRSTLLTNAGFVHALPERDVTDSELLAALGVSHVAQAKQVHGASVVDALETQDREADAIVARASGGRLAVGVRVADCVPVLVADEATGDVAAIHAGWRGVVAGVVRAGVEGLNGRSIVAAIGPCIGACCFEVGRDVADAIAREAQGARVIVHGRADKAYVDLRAVRDSRIDDVAGCTKHDERFHSFRRDGADSGRMLAAVVTR
jgi:YfiH family protein